MKRAAWLLATTLVGCRTAPTERVDSADATGDDGAQAGATGQSTAAGGTTETGGLTDATGDAATQGDPATDDGATDDSEGDTDSGGSGDVVELPALARVNDGAFATSLVCADCHSNAAAADAMRDELGAAIAPDDLWRATMMANSSRDPFWRAVVRGETLATPSRAEEIEAECLQCHAPMAAIRNDLFDGTPLQLSDLGDGDSSRSQFALDGVACAACHQVPAEDRLGPPQLPGDGRMLGPHASPFTMPMAMQTGFTPAESSHVLDSALCGTCHTLRTEPLAADGTVLGGHFSEQAPYLEWRNSAFTTESQPGPEARSCQDCHLPKRSSAGVDIQTSIARRPMGDDFPPISARAPFGRHVMVGGNTLVLSMLRDFADELRPRGTREEFDATIERTRDQLGTRTATLAVLAPNSSDNTLSFSVRASNEAGHKFPSGVPVRRAWLRVTVTDGAGDRVFESGGFNASGQLLSDSGDVLPLEVAGGPIEPHHSLIDDGSQVQIYESVMMDPAQETTFRLLRATGYRKDNRLLPRGWVPDGPHAAETAPVLGGSDSDFFGGQDDTAYSVAVGNASGPFTVDVTLLYQPIAARFVDELVTLDAVEIRAFDRMWQASDRSPELVATASYTFD